MKHINFLIAAIVVALLLLINSKCTITKSISHHSSDTLYTNVNKGGLELEIRFIKGPEHNYPLMAIWITDTNNNYIESLYVAESIAKGVFGYGDRTKGMWLPGPQRRPAALPVWSHNRNVKETDGLYVPTPETAMPDAVTGATPPSDFTLITRTQMTESTPFYLYFEINQTWDWNEYWTNNKYPDNEDYKTSCQPSLIYNILVNRNTPTEEWLPLKLTGRGHYSGADGSVYHDLNTITTALDITGKIELKLR